MKFIINGKEQEGSAELAIAQLLEQLGIPRAGTAVAINGAIVPRDEHEGREILDGDRIDILRAIGGG